MAYFIGDIVPAAYARLAKFFTNSPQYMLFPEDSEIYSVLAKAADLLDDGVIDGTTQYIDKPITGVGGVLDFDDFDMVEGGLQSGTITPSVTPSDTDKEVVYTYSSSNTGVATVAAGVITAVGEGDAVITLGIAGTQFKKTFAITVADTTEE